MPRVVVHEVLIGAGLALLVVAGAATAAAQRSLGRYEREVAARRAQLDSLVALDGSGDAGGREVGDVARVLAETEFNARATRELRVRLWRPGGLGMLGTAGGVVLLALGGVVWGRGPARRPRRSPGAGGESG